jgi:type IV pilus assembly protein PilV
MDIRSRSGASLVEALVALVVSGLALAAIATSQARAVASIAAAGHLETATEQAGAMAAMMHVNAVFWGEVPGIDSDAPEFAAAPADCRRASCDARELAVYDLRHWNVELGDLLPQGHGSVACIRAAQCELRVSWGGRIRPQSIVLQVLP